MKRDKYGAGQDPYCYPGSTTLRNRLNLQDEDELSKAELDLSSIAANEIEFMPPPYGLARLKQIHKHLFCDVYDWAGEIRTVDISKEQTRFCSVQRIEPESTRIFDRLAQNSWFADASREALVSGLAEVFGDVNVIHPFREGNGRAQRILFDQIVVNAGYEINWWIVNPEEWIGANVDAVICDYRALTEIFGRCVGNRFSDS